MRIFVLNRKTRMILFSCEKDNSRFFPNLTIQLFLIYRFLRARLSSTRLCKFSRDDNSRSIETTACSFARERAADEWTTSREGGRKPKMNEQRDPSRLPGREQKSSQDESSDRASLDFLGSAGRAWGPIVTDIVFVPSETGIVPVRC